MKNLTIFALSCAVVGLVLALLWRKAKESENEAIAEHLEAVEGQLDSMSKLRREKRIGRFDTNGA